MTRIQEWEELNREIVFGAYSRKVVKVIFRLPNATTADFYIRSEGPASSVLALTTDGQVILVRQYRPGPKEVLNELPGGFVDANEDPLQAARREFAEETGYDGDFEFVGTCIDDAYSTMTRYCYVARQCRRIGEPKNSDREQTEVVLMPVQEFRRQLRSGRMTDVEVGYLCLDYLGLL